VREKERNTERDEHWSIDPLNVFFLNLKQQHVNVLALTPLAPQQQP
jgi:hypothetical protein